MKKAEDPTNPPGHYVNFQRLIVCSVSVTDTCDYQLLIAVSNSLVCESSVLYETKMSYLGQAHCVTIFCHAQIC